MPRGSKPNNQPTSLSVQRNLIWASGGKPSVPLVDSWDLKTSIFAEAALAIIASGATLVIRPGSGGRALGVAIWEGDDRHPPQWCYDEAELDEWAAGVVARWKEVTTRAAD